MSASSVETARGARVIKRYTNRKLYDTVERRYVTLDEIAEMVKQGTEVSIIDHVTKKDLTSVTLAQIVFEEEKKSSQMPLSVLRDIIRAPAQTVNAFISTQVSPRVDAIKQGAEARIDRLLGVEPGTVDLRPSALIEQSKSAIESWQGKLDERVRTVVDSVAGNLPAVGRDMNVLVTRLEKLENKVSELEGAKRK